MSAIIAKLIRAGVDPALVAEVADALADVRPKGGRADRNARYYEAHKEEITARRQSKTTDKRLNSDASKTTDKRLKPTETVLIQTPLARVEDNLLTTEVTGLAVAVVERREADDWPEGNALATLCAAAGSPRLDCQKQHGLVTSAGRLAAWRIAGAGWEAVVVPVVRALARKQGPPINSWTYFDAAIGQAVADARKPLTIPEPRHERHDTPSAKRLAREDNLSRGLAAFDAVSRVERIFT